MEVDDIDIDSYFAADDNNSHAAQVEDDVSIPVGRLLPALRAYFAACTNHDVSDEEVVTMCEDFTHRVESSRTASTRWRMDCSAPSALSSSTNTSSKQQQPLFQRAQPRQARSMKILACKRRAPPMMILGCCTRFALLRNRRCVLLLLRPRSSAPDEEVPTQNVDKLDQEAYSA